MDKNKKRESYEASEGDDYEAQISSYKINKSLYVYSMVSIVYNIVLYIWKLPRQ